MHFACFHECICTCVYLKVCTHSLEPLNLFISLAFASHYHSSNSAADVIEPIKVPSDKANGIISCNEVNALELNGWRTLYSECMFIVLLFKTRQYALFSHTFWRVGYGAEHSDPTSSEKQTCCAQTTKPGRTPARPRNTHTFVQYTVVSIAC